MKDKLAQQRRSAKERLRPIAEKRRRGEKLTRKDIEEAMKVLCYGHPAFCCSLRKRCGYRDSLLKTLGLRKKEYTEYKRECIRMWWSFIKKKNVLK